MKFLGRNLKYGIYNRLFLYGMASKATSEVLSISYRYNMCKNMQNSHLPNLLINTMAQSILDRRLAKIELCSVLSGTLHLE